MIQLNKIIMAAALASATAMQGHALTPVKQPTAAVIRQSFAVGDKSFMLNGKPFVVKAAEIHYPRIPRQYW